jgi:DNA primase
VAEDVPDGDTEASGIERVGASVIDLDDPLFEGANATKRDLVDYLDRVDERLLPLPHDRALSVIRVHPWAGGVHAEEPAQIRSRVGRPSGRSG